MARAGAAVSVLVTGGAGYIGSHATQRLLELGEEVIVYDNLSTGLRAAVPENSKFIFGDIRDQDLLARIFKDHKVESVLHFAAKSVVPESVASPLDYYENNVLGTLQILKAAQKCPLRHFIFSSSASVYGDPQSLPLLEGAALAPGNPYGETKKMGEKIIQDLAAGLKLSYVLLRYFNVAGARKDLTNGQRTEKATHLIKVASEAACGARDGVEVYGTDFKTPDGTGVRDYIDVEDLVEAHVLALGYLRAGGKSEIFNCGYGHGFSVLEVLETMKRVSARNFQIYKKPRRPGDAAKSFAGVDKIRTALDWRPKYDDLETICRSAFQWEQRSKAAK